MSKPTSPMELALQACQNERDSLLATVATVRAENARLEAEAAEYRKALLRAVTVMDDYDAMVCQECGRPIEDEHKSYCSIGPSLASDAGRAHLAADEKREEELKEAGARFDATDSAYRDDFQRIYELLPAWACKAEPGRTVTDTVRDAMAGLQAREEELARLRAMVERVEALIVDPAQALQGLVYVTAIRRALDAARVPGGRGSGEGGSR